MRAAGGQLEKAVAELAARNRDANPNNDVEVITIDIGGNDLWRLLAAGQPCLANTQAPECQAAFANALTTFSTNLPAILGTLRSAAGPNTTIIVMTYYNPFSGTGTPLDTAGDEAFAQLNGIIKTVAASPAVNARVADVFSLFKGKGPQLTHILRPDIHPNDAGYALIAGAFAAVLAPVPAVPPAGGVGGGQGGELAWWVFATLGAGSAAAVAGSGILWLARRRPKVTQAR